MYIYMSRHGESINNTLNIIGGDCHITENGWKYNAFLVNYFRDKKVTVWTSKLIRTRETAVNICENIVNWEELNEINSGIFEGKNLSQIRKQYSNIYNNRNGDKLNNKYPEGETYLDLKKRVFRVLDTLDMSSNGILVIIAHQAICRVIYSYFTGKTLGDCTDIPINLHTLYMLNNEDKNFIVKN